jgi:hypothetical protein
LFRKEEMEMPQFSYTHLIGPYGNAVFHAKIPFPPRRKLRNPDKSQIFVTLKHPDSPHPDQWSIKITGIYEDGFKPFIRRADANDGWALPLSLDVLVIEP